MSSIWRPVPALTGYFDTVETRIIEQEADRYTVASISAALKYHWDRVQEGRVVKRAKPKTTRSAFTTQQATLGEDAEPAAAEANKPSEKPNEKSSKKKGSGKRKRSNENSSINVAAATSSSGPQSSSSSSTNPQKQSKLKCNACGGMGHKFTRCFLVRGEEKDWVDREISDSNMKVPSFRKRVEDVRSATKVFDEANKGANVERRREDGSSKRRRIVGRVSSLSEFETSSRETNTEYSPLDSAASVHVFHTQQRFANFRRSSRDEGLLCGTSYVPIEGWGQVSLPLLIGSQTRLLLLKKVTFVSDFPLNLVSLAGLEDQGLDWSHRTGEI